MRIRRQILYSIPLHVDVVVLHEMHAEVEANVLQLDLHWEAGTVEPSVDSGDGKFPILDSDGIDALSLERHIAADMDRFLGSVEPQCCHFRVLVLCVLYHHPQTSDPSHLLSLSVGHEQSVHVQEPVADEVKGEALFPLDGVAELFATGELDAEMWVPSQAHG